MKYTVSLTAIVDPLGAGAILLSLVPADNAWVTANIARKSTFVLLVASLLTLDLGNLILGLFGINVDSVRVIGGVILFLVSIDMVQGELYKSTRHTEEETDEALTKEDVSIIPLGIPILFGPGMIAALVALKSKTTGVADIVAIHIAIIITCALTYLALSYARKLLDLLGITGIKIITRLMGLIVGAIAVQFVISGVKALWAML
ncbi:MarC family protein [Thermosulfidibacter takaii]|uniref:MarC family protein n=1 Tax=Thermosulfidibacter takaii TaxID=412593 RepID=UPI0022B2507E|nr:MarC family protein [Thermosulfidibacter takaii]